MSKIEQRPDVFFIANCMFRDHLAGGDVHFLHMAEAVVNAGYRLRFVGGHAVQRQVEARGFKADMLLTDKRTLPPFSTETLGGQLRLLVDYLGRFFRALPKLSQVKRDDIVYAVTDYWFDAWPMIFSRAGRKLMILGMDSPTLKEILLRSRPDVTASRLSSIYYWLSQSLSLRLFRLSKNKTLFYVHPAMKPRLRSIGYREDELVYISNGIDVEQADAVPDQPKIYDTVWAGRIHAQKGIPDLLSTLEHLSKTIENFRALIIGRVQNELAPQIEARGLSPYITFSGFVSEEEKFRLLKSSRVFLMPSHYESWGIVIGEALACGLKVVAYDLEPYRAIFGSRVTYVPQFNLGAFCKKVGEQVLTERASPRSPESGIEEFKNKNSWRAAESIFIQAVNKHS